jgi:malate dehydrogenase (oxaloacetate-decarboxylating)
MGIPIGKLSLYVAGAGINPANCLPVTLDVGTDNEVLLNDPLYLGLKNNRLRGESYFAFIDKFVSAVKSHFPNTILQWEDFSKQNAFTLLDTYREALPSFNDDIQGTGAVTLAGIKGALRIKGEKLPEQIFAVYGAGAGGIGVARQILTALVEEGLSEGEAKERIYVLDSRGVICEGRKGVDEYKRGFARPADFAGEWNLEDEGRVSLMDMVRNGKPKVLLGLSGVAGSFDEKLVKEVCAYCERPVIFPLSNPTSSAEASPEEIYLWSAGKAIVATGSPFNDVNYRGRVFKVGQGNNVFIFPGLGLGALLVKAEIITGEMFTVAARKLSELVSKYRLDLNCVYPAISDLRFVCGNIAVEVALKAMEQNVAKKPVVPELLEEMVSFRMWEPRYARFTRGTEHL